MAEAEETAVGVATGSETSGETVFRRGPGAREAAWVDQLLRCRRSIRKKPSAERYLTSVHTSTSSKTIRLDLRVA